jgi:hypothetical protein
MTTLLRHGRFQSARSRAVFVIVILLGATDSGAAQPSIPPSAPPVAQAYALADPPSLDGVVLGDPAWQGVKATTGFWQIRPDEGRAASQRTEVFVGFTKNSLYIGVVCYDDNPQGIIVADSRRDSSLVDTDSFQVMIDSFHDRQNGFVFGTNPAGIEYDGQVTKESAGTFSAGGGGFNLNWDTTWAVKATISAIGWSAEMEIPFKSLRYSGEPAQVWGINFQRNIRRNNEIAFWSPLSRQHNLYRISQAGSIEGIRVARQRNLKITPYALGRATRGGNDSGTDFAEEFGIDVKYSLTPSLTLDATYNTDFAQVEVDELQVNLNRFSLFFPEKRPFFLENAGQFAVGTPGEVELFFSRRIGVDAEGIPLGIDAGLRLSGKVGASTNVGLLHMRSEAVEGLAPRNDYSVARVNQELPNRSSVGAIFVNRNGDGSLLGDSDDDDYNRTYAVDGRWGIGDNTVIAGYVGKTDTPGLTGKDHAFSLRADYSSAKWSNGIGYTEIGDDFNPEVGFLARQGYRKADLRVLRRYRPANWWGLHELRPHVAYRGFWDFDGTYQSGFIHIDNHWEWKNGVEIHTGMNITHEGVTTPFDIVDGVTVPVDEYDHEEAQLVLLSDEGAAFSASLRATAGGLFGGDRVSLQPAVKYRIGETFSTELSWNYNDIDLPVTNGHFKINLARLRVSYSFTPKILLQALVQYDDRDDLVATNLRFSWLQSANAGLFLVYNEIDEEGLRKPRREIILKYSRIVDLLR